MHRPLFLIAAFPSFFGAIGHAYLGERAIFPNLLLPETRLSPAQIRILRVTWHLISITFLLFGTILAVFAFKRDELSELERFVVRGIGAWFGIAGVAGALFWDRRKMQPWVFLLMSMSMTAGLHTTP